LCCGLIHILRKQKEKTLRVEDWNHEAQPKAPILHLKIFSKPFKAINAQNAATPKNATLQKNGTAKNKHHQSTTPKAYLLSSA
jgi:hypothetical protein